MKRIFHHWPKLALLAVSTIVLATSFSATAAATYGPNRSTKAWTAPGQGFNYVTFDSLTGVPNGIGNEEDFFRGLDVGRDSTWSNPVKNVAHGSEVEAQIYIDNDASSSLNASGAGVAHNVTVRVALPTGLATAQNPIAYISASNASPKTVYDTMQVTGANGGYFELQYDAGSAQVHEQNGSVTNLTTAQQNALFSSSGVNLGDQDGCTSFVKIVTFKMNVLMPNYTITKQVGEAGQSTSTITNSINANPGDTLGWLITFQNIGEVELQGVKIVDNVPTGLTIVPGSVKLINGNYPSGYVFPASVVQENGRQINLNIGDYNPGAVGTAYVTYRTTVESAADLACGNTSFVNEAFATPEGLGSIESSATAHVDKVCQPTTTTTPTPPTPTATTTSATPAAQLVNTGPGNVFALFGGATIVGTVAHRLFSRRLARK